MTTGSGALFNPPATIMVDNLSTQFSVNNPDTNKIGTRHLDMRLFKVRDYIAACCVQIIHDATQFNVADMFIKSLSRPTFTGFVMLFMTDPERH